MTQIEGKDKYVRNVFNTIAPKYDLMNLLMTWGMLPGWQKFMLQKTGVKSGDMCLDVCCGTGELAIKMSKLVGPEGKVWGLDFSENMLKIAREKVRKQGQENIQFIQGDALALPFKDNTFAAVTNGFALRNVTDIPKVISEMARVVKPGGRVVCLEVSRPKNMIFRLGFNIYFFKLVPLLGRIVDRGKAIDDKYPAYTWLPESLKTFPDQQELKAIFERAGLKDVAYFGLGGGVATVHIGVKPE
ncbi:MAG: demethylmenaquinone methyltransferase [Clostridia bacterium]|nr:demethylmenaquinone methyltransferase [Clostridia bacterium]